MDKFKNISVIGLLIMAVGVLLTVYTVDEKERAILLRLGEIVKADIEPGLHFKIPGLNTVRKFDGRIMTLDTTTQRYLTSEKKAVLVDSYVNWRISDSDIDGVAGETGVGRYFTATRGDELRAGQLIGEIISKNLRDEFANRTIQEVVSGEREQIMTLLVKASNEEARSLGVEIIDVRVKRIDLPTEVSQSVYERMQAAREKIARDIRSKGAEESEVIRANADRQRTVTLANAYKDSEILRGEGDAKAAEIYANAYEKDPEFYAFSRRLNAYKQSLNSKDDLLVLQPDSEFFKFFKESRSSN